MPRYAGEYIANEQPYTIEIELPKQKREHSSYHRHHHQHYDRGSIQDYYADDDEDDEYENGEYWEERVMQAGNKRIRVKVRMKLTFIRNKFKKNWNNRVLYNTVFYFLIGRYSKELNRN